MAPVPKTPRVRHRQFLKEWREFNKLSQETAAEVTDMSRENYGRIEAGTVPYNQDFLERLAERYRIPVGFLTDVNPYDDDKARRAYEMLAKADDVELDKALKIITTLLAPE